MKFSEALAQYLDARDKLRALCDLPDWRSTLTRRDRESDRMREAADVMDRLAPDEAKQ